MRRLAVFWAAVLAILVMGAGVLQWLGPPPAQVAQVTAAPTSTRAVAAPDKALLEPSPDYPGGFLPRIGPDGRRPSLVYAAAAAADDHRPRVAILLAGIGMSQSDSEAAVNALPAAVSLAVSPYAVTPDPLLAQIRARGHEYFVSIPMEPRGYPLDDPGNRALLTGNIAGVNDQRLAWALTRFGGYVGATGALGALHGERFADSAAQMGTVLAELSRRGLLYVDPRPGAATTTGRAVDVTLDDTPGGPEIDARLTRLEQAARDQGAAIGLMSLPRPVALDRLAAWIAGLDQRGLALVPVSAVMAGSEPKS